MFLVLTRTGRAWLSGTLVAAFKEAGDTARSEIVKMFGKAVVIVPVALIAGVTAVEVSEDQVETDRIEAETQRLLAFPDAPLGGTPADTASAFPVDLSAGFVGPTGLQGMTASYVATAAADGTCPSYNGVDVFFEWNPNDYADRAAMVAASSGSATDSVTLETGMTLPDGTTGKTARFWHSGDGNAEYADLIYSIAGASTSATDDVWIEWHFRYSQSPFSWETASATDAKSQQTSPNSGTRIMPHLNHAGPQAWHDAPGDGFSTIAWGPFTTDSIYGWSYSRDAILFGGTGSNNGSTWHRHRMRIEAEDAGSDGAIVHKVDSVPLLQDTASPADGGVSGINLNLNNAFTHVTTVWPLGSNHGPNNSSAGYVWKETAYVCYYNEDPGWDFGFGSDGLTGN